jgi:hypothetical protein
MTESIIHELNRNIWKEGKIVAHLCEYAGHIFKHKRLGVKVRVISWDSFNDTVFYKQGGEIKQQFLCDFNDLFEYVGKAKYSEAELDKLSLEIEVKLENEE